MPGPIVPDEQVIKAQVTQACAMVAEQNRGKQGLHQLLQKTVARLSDQFALRAHTEYPLPGYRGDRNGYLDVVWEYGAIPVVAFEIDSAFRVKSLEKLLVVSANLRFWVIYGVNDGAVIAKRLAPAIIRIIELPAHWDATGPRAETDSEALASSIAQPAKSELHAKRPLSFTDIRKHYPTAYERWSLEDDRSLELGYKNGEGIWELARRFGRKPSAIRSRLMKLGLLDD